MEQKLNFLRNITFRQLQIFACIAKYNSFTRAAEALYLTQPTVSAQMKKLEDAIGTPLFEQVGRKIYLTELAQELARTCQALFETLHLFEDKLLDFKGIQHGSLKLAGVTTTEYFAPILLGIFQQSYPNIRLELNISSRENLNQRLLNNVDDLYITDILAESIELVWQKLFSNNIVFFTHPTHPMQIRSNIDLQHLFQESVITRELHSGTRNLVENYLSSNGIELIPRFEISSNEAIKRAVLANLGIGILPELAIAEEIKRGELSLLTVGSFKLSESWYMCHLKSKKLSPVAILFYEFLSQKGEEIIDLLINEKVWS